MKFKELNNYVKSNGQEITVKKKIEHKEISIDKLDSMLDYQRDIDMDFVNEKVQDGVFDFREVDEVKVSVRPDGSMKICDGQHTVAILKIKGYKTAKCELRYGLSIEEENDWFAVTNMKERSQQRKRTLTAQINGTYEKNKEVQDFYNCIKQIGLRLDIYGEKGESNKICCASSLLKLYQWYAQCDNIDGFVECMEIIKECFNGEKYSLQWSFINGMFLFYKTYPSFDRKRLIKVMIATTAKSLSVEAGRDLYSKPSLGIARVIVNKYNSGLSKTKRLKISMLED